MHQTQNNRQAKQIDDGQDIEYLRLLIHLYQENRKALHHINENQKVTINYIGCF